MRILFALFFVVNTVQCARILGVYPLPWYSHFKQGETILKELAARGHQVTVISSFSQKERVNNYRDVMITELNEITESQKNDKTFFKCQEHSSFKHMKLIHDTLTTFADLLLQNEDVQNLLRSNQSFDLVILEYITNEAHLGFMHHFKAPIVLTSSVSPSLWTGTIMGGPVPFAYIPNFFAGYSPIMNFWQRMHNTFAHTLQALYSHFVILSQQDEILHKYFPDAPPIEDLMYNVSVLLINHHPTIGAAVPLQPNMIEVAGFHVQNNRPLPAGLQRFLDEAKEGVIYFSMGSFLQSTDLPQETIGEILKAFSKLKMKVLWKWENDDLPGKPANVRIEKWLPQQAVLAHKNVKLFITHGGRLSIIEAIYFGKPILGIPIFGDQGSNIEEAANLGYCIHLPLPDLNEDNLSRALKEIIQNPKYAETAKYRSNALHDLSITPLDNAIYWIEYAIKHKDLPHLKNASLNLRWYQLLLLDIVFFWLILLWILKKALCALVINIYRTSKEKLKIN